MAAALRDPSLRIAYRRPGRGAYVDSAGIPVRNVPDDTAVTYIERYRQPVAAVRYNVDLVGYERFVQAAGAAALMRLEKTQLEADLKASTADLASSRTRLVGTAHAERRRLERDLHDGVQSELVALIVKLALAHQDPETPPALMHTLAELEAHAQSALDSVRDIAQGIYPTLLADLGLREALRAQAMRVAIRMRLEGTAPRSTERTEEAVYFSCSEAIQNVAKHAGFGAHVALRLDYLDGTLAVRMADDGRGFDPVRTAYGAGLRNIRDRIEDVGGSSTVTSDPGRGTVLTISLPWPPRGDPGP
jgi:signal transduction histidine kinase